MRPVLAQVPHLRRHACLLAGSKDVGDEYVYRCLELVMARPKPLDVRVQLFKSLYSVCRAVSPEATNPEATDFEARVVQGLASLAPIERWVLLLSVVEEFPLTDISRILDLSIGKVGLHLASARRELNSRVSMPVLIIEDDPLIAMKVAQPVEEMGLVVARRVANRSDALASATHDRPGLVVANIQLQNDGSGLMTAQAILERYDLPIVFVPGFPERLASVDSLEPAFVVPTPFTSEGLKATIARALAIYRKPLSAAKHRAKVLAKLRQIACTNMVSGR